MIERVKEVIKKKAKSIREFASLIGIKQVTLNQQVSGSRGLSLEIISAILNSFEDISAEWLLRGRGEMYLSSEEQESKTLSNKSQEELQLLREKIIRLEAENKVLREVAGLSNAEAIKGKSA